MATNIIKAPRCANHPPMSAVMQCEKCHAFLCRLCTSSVKGIETCSNCRGACRILSQEQLGSEAKRQTTMIQNRGAVVPPPPAAPSAVSMQIAALKSKEAAKAPATKITSAPPTAAQPPAPSAGDAKAEAKPLAPFERKPPYFCKKHEKTKATRHCDHCTDDYCNTCAKMIEDNPHCPECGGQLKALMPDEQGFAKKSMGTKISEALAFPFKGSGKIMLILGVLFMWVLSFAGTWGRNFSYVYMLAYVMKVCRTSASGREAPPEWPAFHEISGAWYFFITKVVSILPAILYLALFTRINILHFYLADDAEETPVAEARDSEGENDIPEAFQNQDISKKAREAREKAWEEHARKLEEKRQAAKTRTQMKLVPYYLLTFLGELYIPMALLALILYRSYDVLNPMFVFSSIWRVKGDYFAVYVTLIVADLCRLAPIVFNVALLEISIALAWVVAPIIATFFWLYLTIVYMRVLGELYYFNQKRIGWFEHQVEPEAAA